MTSDTDFETQTRRLLDTHGATLLQVAEQSIRFGLDHDTPLSVAPDEFDPDLRALGASFVSLHAHGNLRGCIGSPQAHRPLIADVAENAFAAAFCDTRFQPLSRTEIPGLALSVSVLSPQAPMTFTSERDLLSQLRPNTDGLVIGAGGRRALFLPIVWEALPEPQTFLNHLRAKAGLPDTYWGPDFKASRFIALEIETTLH